ncbi:hypothetical protein SAMN05216227_10223 [Pseudorhodobacter antarcticus]|uniref:Uncharacterized protein n=1 Tax=Pseudorhodobacter antarcticus TaxID=1077947 RepID=A0A1H8IUD3_9RHOB|nr:hypothetical protein SAMN05216227_10223 [Pseudorhodobacter antarcticus]
MSLVRFGGWFARDAAGKELGLLGFEFFVKEILRGWIAVFAGVGGVGVNPDLRYSDTSGAVKATGPRLVLSSKSRCLS